MRVNTRSINSTTERHILKKDAPQWHIRYISGTLGDTGVHRHKTEPIFILMPVHTCVVECALNVGYNICPWELGWGREGVLFEDVPLVEFMCLVFTRMPGESYRRRLTSLLLCLCDVFRALISSLVC